MEGYALFVYGIQNNVKIDFNQYNTRIETVAVIIIRTLKNFFYVFLDFIFKFELFQENKVNILV